MDNPSSTPKREEGCVMCALSANPAGCQENKTTTRGTFLCMRATGVQGAVLPPTPPQQWCVCLYEVRPRFSFFFKFAVSSLVWKGER